MAKTALNDEVKKLYAASVKTPKFVSVPKMPYLMVDGQGDPNTSKEFQDAVQALYSLAYTIKFGRKKRGEESDYRITPLEGLWWSDDMSDFATGNKAKWKWTLMLAQPEFITKAEVTAAVKEVTAKKDVPALPKVRFEKWKEGECVQIMYVGPYAEEGPTIQKLHIFIIEQGAQLTGKHHEIYLGDPRRAAPDKLKTILRQPLKRLSRSKMQ